MSNPNINFRLSPYQLARGLWLIRKLEPSYHPSSLSKMVKLIYSDYIAKMNYSRSNIVPQEIIEEVESLCFTKGIPATSFNTFIKAQESSSPFTNTSSPTKEKTESVITTVTDFSPPLEWSNND